MVSRYRIGLFIASLLFAVLFFLASPENVYAGSILGGPPCCEVPDQNFCLGGEEALIECQGCLEIGSCIFYEERICVPIDGSDAFGSCVVRGENIPTLGEWGLIALAVVLGAAGYIYMVIRRRKAVA